MKVTKRFLVFDPDQELDYEFGGRKVTALRGQYVPEGAEVELSPQQQKFYRAYFKPPAKEKAKEG